MKRAVLRVSPELLVAFLSKDGFCPSGARVVDARVNHFDSGGHVEFVLESEEYNDTKEGDLYPVISSIRFGKRE